MFSIRICRHRHTGIHTSRSSYTRYCLDAGAHKGIDYVNGYFGPQARIDRRELQLRWMDHYLKGIDNGVDVQAARLPANARDWEEYSARFNRSISDGVAGGVRCDRTMRRRSRKIVTSQTK